MAKHNFVAEVYNLLSKFQSMQDKTIIGSILKITFNQKYSFFTLSGQNNIF